MARVWQKNKGCMRLVSINVNGLGDDKERSDDNKFLGTIVDVLGISEMYTRRIGLSDGREGVWEGVPGGLHGQRWMRSTEGGVWKVLMSSLKVGMV